MGEVVFRGVEYLIALVVHSVRLFVNVAAQAHTFRTATGSTAASTAMLPHPGS
jgi:hypothetical protein